MCSLCTETNGPSGFGFELTFRLRREPGETAPPTWPAALLQALARYVFQSGQLLNYHLCTKIKISVFLGAVLVLDMYD